MVCYGDVILINVMISAIAGTDVTNFCKCRFTPETSPSLS